MAHGWSADLAMTCERASPRITYALAPLTWLVCSPPAAQLTAFATNPPIRHGWLAPGGVAALPQRWPVKWPPLHGQRPAVRRLRFAACMLLGLWCAIAPLMLPGWCSPPLMFPRCSPLPLWHLCGKRPCASLSPNTATQKEEPSARDGISRIARPPVVVRPRHAASHTRHPSIACFHPSLPPDARAWRPWVAAGELA
ncbi:MAG: hypothetical protein J3K34DRAFT_421029 [Monoraphidium minutum]|nr:MAG: hypothetical protein J3K34DRAFT_421029 [Monoraphidium minutum]